MKSAEDPRGQTIMLVDGHGLAYRAFHAVPETLATAKGEVTNAVFGFTSMLLDALRQHQPDYVIVSFDVGRTFRHEAFADYKGTRAPMPGELRHQMKRIHEVLAALNIPVYTREGYEADDVIGTLARMAEAQGMQPLIVTGDSDLLQLVDNAAVVVLPGRQRFGEYRTYDRPAVEQRYGFAPERLPDYKALVGDTSDNIPGVPGIGDKTAKGLIAKYPSLEAMREQLDEITPPRARQALADNFEQALEGRRLATIVRDVPLEVDIDGCRLRDFDRDHVLDVFRELEFRTLVSRLPEPEAPAKRKLQPVEAAENFTVTTSEQLDAMVAELRAGPAYALDVETDSLDSLSAALVGISLASSPARAYYIPLRHQPADGQLPLETVRERLSPLFADGPAVYAHNGKFDAEAIEHAGFPRPEITFDSMIAAYLLGETALGLKELAFTRLGLEMQPITELIGKGKSQITFDQVPIEAATTYGCADVEATYRLVNLLAPELAAQHQTDLFHTIEMPLIDVLIDMEQAGIAIDSDFLITLSAQLSSQISELEREIHQLAGHEFNINSTRQLGTVLFDELNLPTGRRTKTGYSVGQDVLESLADAHPIIAAIGEYRSLLKLRSTYVDALPEQVSPIDGRVHTSFNQTIAATGRLSSTDPNLQNIPVRTEIGRQVRRAFIADNRPGYRPWTEDAVFLSIDYSQIELRLMAHMSEDPTLINSFQQGHDIHAATASDVFGVPLDAVTPDMRRIAKTVNFGIMYGMQAFGLSRDTGMPRAEAQRFIERYMARLPGVRRFLDETKLHALEKGYVESIFGRRRYVPDIASRNPNLRLAAERMAINMPLQGTAADIMKLARIRVREALREQQFRARMLLQVHDELLFEAPVSEVPALTEVVREIMENVVELSVPLVAEAAAGPNWDQLEPV
ncbi:MAG TPA: DNA polymerase I [Nitrolancea sp.]|nr:DNA polymerase I [Nitrolancea sp.]